MNVLLVSANVASTPYPVYPLGLSMVAAALKNAGHQVVQFDFLAGDMSLDRLSLEINRVDPGLIGISIRNIDNVNLVSEQRYIHVVKQMVRRIRKVTDIPVVLGGSGFSIMPEELLKEIGADYGLVGEGEQAAVRFVNDAEKGRFPATPCVRIPQGLCGDDIPSALYDPDLMSFYLKSGNVASVQTKRGCTQKCVYCTYPLLEGRAIRSRNPEKVVDDIQLLADRFDARYLFFTDSVFNDDGGSYMSVVREMIRRNVTIPWGGFFKPGGITDSQVEMMKRTGLKAVEIGADASTDRTLKKLGKSFGFDDIIACNDLFGRHNIATAHFFMFGCPGETRETVLEGIQNIRDLKNTVSFIFMGIRILPHTPLEKIAVSEGLIRPNQPLLDSVYYIPPGLDRQWLEKTLLDGFDGARHCVFPPDAMDSSLQFLHKLGYSGSLWEMLIPGHQQRLKRHGKK